MKRRKQILGISSGTSVHGPSSADVLTVSDASHNITDASADVNQAVTLENLQDTGNVSMQHIGDTPWRLCYDEKYGYPYYWNVETNEVKWELTQEELGEGRTTQTQDSDYDENDSKKLPRRKESAIEMITSYGEEEEQEDDVNTKKTKDHVKKHKRGMLDMINDPRVRHLISLDVQKSKQLDNAHDGVIGPQVPIIGPSLPTDVVETQSFIGPMMAPNEQSAGPNAVTSSHNISIAQVSSQDPQKSSTFLVPYGEEDESAENVEAKINPLVEYDDDDDNEESESDEENDESIILQRLREKAVLLKRLGGVVPDDLKHLVDETKSVEEVIAEIEKELPPDYSETGSTKNLDQISASSTATVPMLVEYGNESESDNEFKTDMNSRTEPGKFSTDLKRSQTKVDQRLKSTNMKVIKLSARAKELIRSSMLTAKARQTGFVETEEGLKPAEDVARKPKETVKDPEEGNAIIRDAKMINKGKLRTKVLEKDIASSAPKMTQPVSDILDAETKRSKEGTNAKSGVSSLWAIDMNQVLGLQPSVTNERRGFGFSQTDEESLSRPVSSGIKFVKAETINLSSEDKPSSSAVSVENIVSVTSEISSAESSKDIYDSSPMVTDEDNITTVDMVLECDGEKEEDKEKVIIDLSALVMEKLKYLSIGKGSVSPVQIMAIQIETLLGAWHAKALPLKYLEDWLEASAGQLQLLEDAAAPEGWICEWDRSFRRYYYRNMSTGAIQWEYPEQLNVQHDSLQRIKELDSQPPPPPPPRISYEDLVSPPAPTVSKTSIGSSAEKHGESHKRKHSLPTNPPLPPSPPPEIPPPPPPSLPPLPTSSSSNVFIQPPMPSSLTPNTIPPPPPPLSPSLPPPPPTTPPPLPSSSVPAAVTTSSGFVISSGSVLYKPEAEVANVAVSKKIEAASDDRNNQAKSDFSSVLDSFYNDIASLQAEPTADVLESKDNVAVRLPSEPPVEEVKTEIVEQSQKVQTKAKKRKIKFDAGLGLKKKGLEGLVAKWQKVHSGTQ